MSAYFAYSRVLRRALLPSRGLLEEFASAGHRVPGLLGLLTNSVRTRIAMHTGCARCTTRELRPLPIVASSSVRGHPDRQGELLGQLRVDGRDVDVGRRPGVLPVRGQRPHRVNRDRVTSMPALNAGLICARASRFELRQRHVTASVVLRSTPSASHRSWHIADDRITCPSDRDPACSLRKMNTESRDGFARIQRRSPETTGMAPWIVAAGRERALASRRRSPC